MTSRLDKKVANDKNGRILTAAFSEEKAGYFIFTS